MLTYTCVRCSHTLSALALAAVLVLPATPVRAQYKWTSSRPDGHAPIGVMADHTHEHGEFMLSYRFMRMAMDGNRDGTDRLDASDVHRDFMVAPLDMAMTMHMAGLMYAPSDVVTLLVMANWVDRSMNHATRAGMSFEAASSGLGDTSVGALIGVKLAGSTRVHLNPMQLGSGTWDFNPGMTVFGMSERASWGLQTMATLRLGENARGYRMGHGADATAWFAVRPGDRLSLSARLLARRWGNYAGHDEAYGQPMMVPTVRAELRGGTRIDVPVPNWRRTGS